MIWLIELALVLLLIGGGWKLFGGRKGTDDRDALTRRRVDAYIETIRRERTNASLAAMTDTELRDVLHSGARNLKIASERKIWVLLVAGGATLAGAIIVGQQDGLRGFAVALVVGALVTYGLNEYLTRRLRAPLAALGIDIERLRVE